VKTVSADEAVALIRPGARVFVAAKAGTPMFLLEALARRAPPDVELFYFLLDGIDPADLAARAPQIRQRPLYVGAPLAREAVGEAVSYVPLSLPAASRLVSTGRLAFDAALVATSEPDENGMLCLGAAVGLAPTVLARVPLAIAEIVPSMPRTAGDTRIPAERFAAAVRAERALPEFRHERDDARDERIGRYISRLVEDGATLQVGPGRVPNGAMRHLRERRGLRVLTDLLSEELAALADTGALAETSDTEPAVMASYCTGGRELFERVAADPRFTFWPIETVADEGRLHDRDRLVSITQALAIDLTGQACCDRIGATLFGGLGSQPEFMRAAAAAPRGRPILALYATDPSGASNIRVTLAAGEGVAIARSDVHFVVTEWGIASLYGKSIEERALAIIEVAHPDHRAALLEEAKATGLVPRAHRATSRSHYRVEDEREVTTRKGAAVLLRPARLADVPEMQRLFHRFPEEDVYLRFFRYLRSLSIEEAVRLCVGDQALDAMYVAVVGDRDAERIIGSAQYFGDPGTRLAEVGYLVDPEWQGSGLGRMLQHLLIDKARAMGFHGLSAQILTDNRRMIQLARSSGLEVEIERDGETCEVTMLF
jgi:acyl-CoA hydrolase/GNAT superfamily N-acetyltransferase